MALTNINWFKALCQARPSMDDPPKKRVVLLGDGFLARGFLHHIDRQKFHITQMYKDDFINPQDVISALAKDERYTGCLHLRDYFHRPSDLRIQVELKECDLDAAIGQPAVLGHPYDYLVVGLGAHKSLKSWTEDINALVGLRDGNIDVVGMGPVGLEIGAILARTNKVHLFDGMTKGLTLTYLSPVYKRFVEDHLRMGGVTTAYGQMYTANPAHKVLFCVGTRPHILSGRYTVDAYLRHVQYPNIFIGGDGANTPHMKTAQSAYQQGAYIADLLNKGQGEPFNDKNNGIALNIGDNKVVLEGHPVMPTGIYPAFITRLYSVLFV